MNNSPISAQMIQMLKGGNPQQIALSMLSQNAKGNPMLEGLLNMANQGNGKGVEDMCKNILRSKGYNPDELMNEFKQQYSR